MLWPNHAGLKSVLPVLRFFFWRVYNVFQNLPLFSRSGSRGQSLLYFIWKVLPKAVRVPSIKCLSQSNHRLWPRLKVLSPRFQCKVKVLRLKLKFFDSRGHQIIIRQVLKYGCSIKLLYQFVNNNFCYRPYKQICDDVAFGDDHTNVPIARHWTVTNDSYYDLNHRCNNTISLFILYLSHFPSNNLKNWYKSGFFTWM